MQNIRDILSKREEVLPKKLTSRPINERWERAKEFGEYVGLPTVFVMRLFKLYGMNRVLALRSYLKDSQCPRNMIYGHIVNKLKTGSEQK